MKKTIIILATVVGLIIVLMSVVPFFIDINKHIKPLLVEAIEKNTASKVNLGELKLSLYRKVRLSADLIKIKKDDLEIDVVDFEIVAPYSALLKSPQDLMSDIRLNLNADEVSINKRKLVLEKVTCDLIKLGNNIKLKDIYFKAFEGRGRATSEIDFTKGLVASLDFEIKDGEWPAEKLKAELLQKAKKIPQAEKLINDLDIDDDFESLKGSLLIENQVTKIQSLTLNAPANKVMVRGSGTIDDKNHLKISTEALFPIENIPSELKNDDGRAKIPVDIVGTLVEPKVDWEKTLELVLHAYTKEEGKKIIKKELNKLKEKLLKDEKVKDFIKGLKF